MSVALIGQELAEREAGLPAMRSVGVGPLALARARIANDAVTALRTLLELDRACPWPGGDQPVRRRRRR